jgi:hypothetical protein
MTPTRLTLRIAFFVSEIVLIFALCVSYVVDPRDPKWVGLMDALAVPGISALAGVIIATFALRRSDPRLTQFGLVTLFFFLVFGALIPAV